MEQDRLRWNRRYLESDIFLGRAASSFLQEQIGLIKRQAPGLRTLDIACGEGRNSIFLAQQGFAVTAIDISDVGIGKARQWGAECGLEIDFRVMDLEGCRLDGQYDLVININFLLRPLISQAVDALEPGGLMIFESLLATPEQLRLHNPDFMLAAGELEQIFSAFAGEILLTEERAEDPFPTARLIFKKAG
jgi:tellurite methyltransferase